MKNGLKRFLSSVLTAAMLTSAMTLADIEAVGIGTAQSVQAAGTVTVKEYGGYQEGAYVEWASVGDASQYVVSYQKAGTSAWTRIDDQLIRQYAAYWRADIVGLSAGKYSIKVDAYDSNGTVINSSAVNDITVTAYKRDGFAFKAGGNTSTPGAYNADGTLKSNAKVIYLTADNFNTVTLTEGGITGTGFGENGITSEKVHGKLASPTPICFRIIGTVKPSGIIKVKASKDYKDMFITFEGIGEDAVIHEGFDIQKSANVEIKNLGISNFSDDGISIQSRNKYVWVHNVDFYYGNAGGDADQAKGDGSLDVKVNSQFCEFSYNHFWDCGKSSLCGMKSETGPNMISYHHNWFDHSDSRHPRIRTMSVHIYNNLFDGNSKYGVGVTYGGSAFVENNIFNGCKHPMLISKQGSDIASDSKGTFSGENGGIIKAYNNRISGAQANEPRYYSSSNTTNFDAYEAKTREEQVPSDVKCVLGGTGYDNANLDPGKLPVPDALDTVEATVKQWAGSVGGGVIDRSKYNAFSDGTDYGVDSTLKTDITNYDSSEDIVSVGGTVTGKQPVAPTEATTEGSHEPTTEEATEEEQPEETTQAPVGGVGSQEHNFTDYSDESDFYIFTAYAPSSSKGDVTYDGRTYTECAKMNSTFTVSFTNGAGATGRLTLVFNAANKGYTVYFDDKSYTIPDDGILIIEGIEGGKTHVLKKNSGESHLYYMLYEDTNVSEQSTQPTTSTTTTKETSTTTTTKAPAADTTTESTTSAPVSDIKGDVDGNGKVETEDAQKILDYLSGIVKETITNADMYEDEKIDTRDSYYILKYIYGEVKQ